MIRHSASFEEGPLYWLTRMTQTEDEHWYKKGTEPVAPFPTKQYFVPLIQAMFDEPQLFIWKSREMMTSWLACGYITWMCETMPHIFWLIQSEKEDKVAHLVNYSRILHRNSPAWMTAENPIVVDNTVELQWKNGSRILAIPKGVNQARMYHPTGYLIDEAAFLPEAEQCYNAVRPVTRQVIAISSDSMGWFHNICKGGH